MKRLHRIVPIRECSVWYSWFAWYPISHTTPHGTYRIWLERVEYRYLLVDGFYTFEYRFPDGQTTCTRKIPVTTPSPASYPKRRIKTQ